MEQVVFEQVIGPVVKFLTGHITNNLGYITYSTKHVNNMTKIMKVLEDTNTDVKNHIDRNNINNKEIPSGVHDWLNDVENVKKKVQSISRDDIGCLNMKLRYRAGKKACENAKTIEELIKRNSEFIWTDAQIPSGRVDSKPTSSSTTSTPSVVSSEGDGFKSRDKPFDDTLKFLQQEGNESQVVALCGMGGVGKTTMMEQLKMVADEKKLFHFIVKVAIGRNPNMLSIQNDIALCLGGDGLCEATESARAECLCRKFTKVLVNGKNKILVILDDVWHKIELKDIGLTSPLVNGIKLLLTSRDSYICKQIAADARSTLQLVGVNVLEEAEGYSFFSRYTGVSEEDDRYKFQIGCDIVKKCGCLPLAIKLIGITLNSQENICVWRNTLNRLNNNDLDDNVQEIISISYEHMKEDKECEEIFLHCGLFPEDAHIPTEYLVRYVWGQKLLKNVSTFQEARDKTHTCIHNLISANLLIGSYQNGYVKMHDLVLAFVLRKVSNGDRAWIINHGDVPKWDINELSKSCKQISLTCTGMSEFHKDFNYPSLRLLQLMNGDLSLKFPKEFFDNMENLQVLAYYKMQFPLLPRSFQCSYNLKSLCLYKCKLMFDYSYIGNLMNLEVLSFAYCGIRKLPSTIGNLRKLKLLDLIGCVNLRIDDGVFENLYNIEEIYMRVSEGKAIRFTDSNLKELIMLSRKLCALEVEFIEETDQLKNMYFNKLDRFRISIGCLLEKEFDDKYLFRNTLRLVINNTKYLTNCKINELLRKTEKLHLQVKDMVGIEDIFSIHHYDKLTFCNLSHLEVSNCVELKYLFPVPVASSLNKLVHLKISSCCVLEAIIYNDGSENNSEYAKIEFKKLMFLTLENLPNLISLSLGDNVVELPKLVELEVEGLPNFTSIYADKNNISALFNSQVKIAKVESLNIGRMEKLEHIWMCSSEEDVYNASMLKEIKVEKCDSLVNLFPTNPMRLLNRLETLEVSQCGSVEEIFNIDLESIGHEAEELSSNNKLRRIVLFGLKKLREVWRIKGGENNSSSKIIRGFEAIDSINIECCKMFLNIFTATTIKFEMKEIVDIRISGECWNDEEEIEFLSRKERYADTTTAFPSNLIHTFHYLRRLHMDSYNGVQVVFEIESSSSRESVTNLNNQQPLLLPNLQHLHLNSMKSMSHVWKCNNWNKFSTLHKQSSFHNLTTIQMRSCDKIKYLFSPLLAKLLSNLKTIDIENCFGLEEIVSARYDKDEEMTISTGFFPRLHLLKFSFLTDLKRIGGGGDAKNTCSVINDQVKFLQFSQNDVVPWSLCQYSREIHIRSCFRLSSVIPSYAITQMQKLQVLEVLDCVSMKSVFETDHRIHKNNHSCDDSGGTNIDEGNGGTHTTSAIPRLQNVSVPQLSNLKKLVIACCDQLQYVFTFSALESLKKLEELTIRECKTMKMIVKRENGEQTTTSNFVVFPRLKTLELSSLPNLKAFFLGMNDFNWPLLENVMISKCPKMMVFTIGQSTTPELKYIYTSIGKHSLECGLNFHVTMNLDQIWLPSSQKTSLERLPWSFYNLAELCIEDNDDVKCIIHSNELQQLQKLEMIRVESCCFLEEVFEVEAMERENSESETVVEIPNLTQMELKNLHSLKYIWKSEYHQRTILLFPNLTTLSIHECDKLEHVFSSSMVGSLLQLQDLHISYCHSLEVIVKEELEEESETEWGAKVKEIVLPCLKSLKLGYLKRLKGFFLGKDDFSCPSLHTLEIYECSQITVFTNGYLTAPALKVIDTSFGRCYVSEDINSFIKTKRHEGFSFGSVQGTSDDEYE